MPVGLLLPCLAMVVGLANQSALAEEPHQLIAAPGTIVVDGTIDEAWDATPTIRLRQSVAVLTRTDSSQWPRSLFRCLWDESHLYVLAEIEDSTPGNQNQTPWEQDSIEVFLDENRARTKFYQSDDAQIRVSRQGQVTGTEFRDRTVVRSAVAKTEHGYLVEMAIRWRTIEPEVGMKLGVDFQVSDDPGVGRRLAILKWKDPSDESWRDTSRFGTLTLGTVQQATEAIAALRDHESTGDTENAEQGDTSSGEQGSTPDGTSKNALPGLKGHGRINASIDPSTGFAQVAASFTADDLVPDWVADAVFYQLFPERFRNGDTHNDPTRHSLEFPDVVPESWQVTPWTQQWYRRSSWEVAMGPNFYENGVFHRRYGGDLQGVLDQLDYLADLGITAIYFNPLFYARSLHKYDGNSFHHIDPHFGPDPAGDFELMKQETDDPASWKWTAADQLFLQLIHQARQRGIRIVLDGVFNHTGRDFFAFADIVRHQQQSRYVDWYNVRTFDDPNTPKSEFAYDGWWGIDTLPEFATSAQGQDLHPGPKAYIFNCTRRWMDPNSDGNPTDGIDGWRLDVANEVPNAFWRDWHALVRSINPAAYTVAEIWDEASGYLADCQFSATMNYHGFAFPAKGFLIDNRISANQFADLYASRSQMHTGSVQFGLLNLLDSHDTDRLASMIINARRQRDYLRPDRFDYDVGDVVSPRHTRDYDVSAPTTEDRQVQKLVSLFQFTVPGPPMLYYGTESGMDGADDPDDRMPMVWKDLHYEPRSIGPDGRQLPTQEVGFNQAIHQFYRDLIQLRNQQIALRRGAMKIVWADDGQQSLLWTRQLGNEILLVALNRSREAAAVKVPANALGLPNHGQLIRIFSTSDDHSTGKIALPKSDQQWTLPPLTGQVWKLDSAVPEGSP